MNEDRRMAEAMGWLQDVDELGEVFYYDNNDPPEMPYIIYDWRPTRSIEQAFMVVEKLNRRFRLSYELGKYYCVFWDKWGISETSPPFKADTPAEAICKAALKAVDEKVEAL